MQTPLGPSQSVLIRGVPLFQGFFIYTRYVRDRTQSPPTLQWISAFQGCPQGRVLLYMLRILIMHTRGEGQQNYA